MRPGTISFPVVMSIFTGASISPYLTRRCARQLAYSSPSRMGSMRSNEYSMPTLLRFRTRKLEALCRHRHRLRFGRRAFEERVHGLRRHPVPDGRVRPPAVVVGLDEIDHGVLRGVPRREALPAIHLIFERSEERLGDLFEYQDNAPRASSEGSRWGSSMAEAGRAGRWSGSWRRGANTPIGATRSASRYHWED